MGLRRERLRGALERLRVVLVVLVLQALVGRWKSERIAMSARSRDLARRVCGIVVGRVVVRGARRQRRDELFVSAERDRQRTLFRRTQQREFHDKFLDAEIIVATSLTASYEHASSIRHMND